MTLSAPKSVSLMALVGGDERIVATHDKAVEKTLAWIELNAVETRAQDKGSGAMVRVGGQKMVAATFRHDKRRDERPWPVAAIRLLTLTGARLPEVLDQRWDEIGSLSEDTGIVRLEDSKTGPRTI